MAEQEKRLEVLRGLLARLTGEELPPAAAAAAVAPPSPVERRLQVLRDLLARLSA